MNQSHRFVFNKTIEAVSLKLLSYEIQSYILIHDRLCESYINHEIEYFWIKNKRKVPRNPRHQQEKTYMVHCGITNSVILKPKWVPSGKTLNSARYKTILKECMNDIQNRY